MCECEARGLPFLFKPRQTEGVVKHLAELSPRREWKFAGGGWRAVSSRLPLQGWTKKRRVVVLHWAFPKQSAGVGPVTPTGQKVLEGMAVLPKSRRLFAYRVLVTSLPEEDVLTVAQQYRDREDAENLFDALKNQWAWRGFTTHDLKRSQSMARIVALVFNGWSWRARLAVPGRHTEAVTSRPALVYGVTNRTTDGNQPRVTITRCHGKAEVIAKLLGSVNWSQRWARLVRILPREFFHNGPRTPAAMLC